MNIKNNQDKLLGFFEKNLNYIFKDKEYSFWFVAFFHYNLSLIIFLQIFLFPTNTFHFKISVLLWAMIVLSNVYFVGSFPIRLEKKLLREVSWDGIYEVLPYFNIPKTKQNIQTTFHLSCLLTYYIILFKIYL